MTSKIEYSVSKLKRVLRERAKPKRADSMQRFSKEPIRSLGVSTLELRKLATAAAKEYRRSRLSFAEILDIVDALWRSTYFEDRVLAIEITRRFKRHLDRQHWKRFDGWVDSLSNWAETDGLCTYVLAPLLEKEPGLVPKLSAWTRARSRWRRRAAAVALVPLARRGDAHDAAYDIVDRLAGVRDDLVEKAIGWLLKEMSRTQPQSVAEYVIDNVDRLSRTTVRYACEKLPPKLRKRVMSA